MKLMFVVIATVAAFLIGLNAGAVYTPALQESVDEAGIAAITSRIGFIETNTTIRGNSVMITGGCYAIEFDVTPDQAYSIATAAANASSQRPLTHDIFKETLDNFGIKLMQVNIDRYEEDVYKATIYMRRGNDVLSIDARPSDSIALALRYGMRVYVRESILRAQGTNIC